MNLKDGLDKDRRDIIRENLGNKGVTYVKGSCLKEKGVFTGKGLIEDMYALGYFIDVFKANDKSGDILMYYSRYKILNYSNESEVTN